MAENVVLWSTQHTIYIPSCRTLYVLLSQAPLRTLLLLAAQQGHPTITSQPINTFVPSPSLPSNTSTVYSQSHSINTSTPLTPNTSDTTDSSHQWLRLCLWNAHSLNNKLPLFQSLETWLSPNVFDREILPHGFSVYQKDRSSRGGWVLVAVSNHIPSKSIQVECPCELIVGNLTVNPNTFIWCTYVPPLVSHHSLKTLPRLSTLYLARPNISFN